MPKFFTRDTLKHSIRPIAVILIVCMIVFLWGKYRKVSVDMTLIPQISGNAADKPANIDVTIYRGETMETEIRRQMTGTLSAQQHLSMRPGSYSMRGIVTMQSGKTHVVEQTIMIPEEDAAIDIYLYSK